MGYIERSRARFEARLTCTGQVTRPSTDPPTVHPTTHVVTPAAPAVVWSGPCSVGDVTDSLATVDRAGRQLEGLEVPVAVPTEGTDVIERGDTFTVSSVGPDDDPGIVGVSLSIDKVGRRSRMVLRRLRCTDTRGTDGTLP